MRQTWFPWTVFFLLVTSLAHVGCSSGAGSDEATPPEVAALNEVGDMLRAVDSPKPPATLADLSSSASFYSRGYEAVKSGEIVVVWGAKMAGEGDASSGNAPKAVIAYEKKTPSDGGYVLLQDGTVEQMSSEQFGTAPKAA